MQDFKQLVVWQKAHELAIQVYQCTATFPKEERYGLTSQMRRASVSIGANISERCGRDTAKEYLHFLQVAKGSASELETYFLLCHAVGFLSNEDTERLQSLLNEIQKCYL
ncbi:MAG: four helix bundle protein [Chloroherpetonaceae bacterium]